MIYRMEISKVVVAMRWMHEKVRAGKWFYYDTCAEMTPTLLGERMKLAIGDTAHVVFHGFDEANEPVLTGSSMEMLRDPDIVPSYVVLVMKQGVSSTDTVRFLWKLWGDNAFMRHTTVIVGDNAIDNILSTRTVIFGYQAEPVAA